MRLATRNVSDPADYEQRGEGGRQRAADDPDAFMANFLNTAGRRNSDRNIAEHLQFKPRPIGNRLETGQGLLLGLPVQVRMRGSKQQNLATAFRAALDVPREAPALGEG